MATRVAVVTGASSGIGRETALALLRDGWRVIGTGRDAARIAAVEAAVETEGLGERFTMLRADLSLMADAVRLAGEIATMTDRVDVLVNNAGGMTDRLEMTPEGLEANFAGNHLGPFVLTERLLPLLHAAAAGAPAGAVRIVMTASDASEMLPALDLDDIQSLRNFNPGFAYCTGKLANVLFAKGLAVRLEGSGIVAHSMAPGATDSNFFNSAGEEARERLREIPKLTEAEGADTLIWLATAEEPGRSSGGYWEKRQPRKPNPLADDPAVVERFWQESEKLIASTSN